MSEEQQDSVDAYVYRKVKVAHFGEIKKDDLVSFSDKDQLYRAKSDGINLPEKEEKGWVVIEPVEIVKLSVRTGKPII